MSVRQVASAFPEDAFGNMLGSYLVGQMTPKTPSREATASATAGRAWQPDFSHAGDPVMLASTGGAGLGSRGYADEEGVSGESVAESGRVDTGDLPPVYDPNDPNIDEVVVVGYRDGSETSGYMVHHTPNWDSLSYHGKKSELDWGAEQKYLLQSIFPYATLATKDGWKGLAHGATNLVGGIVDLGYTGIVNSNPILAATEGPGFKQSALGDWIREKGTFNYDDPVTGQIAGYATEGMLSLFGGDAAKLPGVIRGLFADSSAATNSELVSSEISSLRQLAKNNGGVIPGLGERSLTQSEYRDLMSQYRSNGVQLQADLDSAIAGQEYVYRATSLRSIDTYRTNGFISGRSGGTYMSTDYVGLDANVLMDRGQVFEHWGAPEVLLRIPTSELSSAVVPRPLGGRLSVGWEPRTQFYPAAGTGNMNQFLGATKSWDDSWVVPLIKKAGQ